MACSSASSGRRSSTAMVAVTTKPIAAIARAMTLPSSRAPMAPSEMGSPVRAAVRLARPVTLAVE